MLPRNHAMPTSAAPDALRLRWLFSSLPISIIVNPLPARQASEVLLFQTPPLWLIGTTATVIAEYKTKDLWNVAYYCFPKSRFQNDGCVVAAFLSGSSVARRSESCDAGEVSPCPGRRSSSD